MSKKIVAESFSDAAKKKIYIGLWFAAMLPFLVIVSLLLMQSDDELPAVEMLDNPPELLASVIYADDSETELGRYWKVNRTTVNYEDISPFVVDALISTEDERFMEHSGVDFPGLGRAVVKLGSNGGASTISQQLAKLLFTLQNRERENAARAAGEDVPERRGGIIGRIDEKAQENIIATRLEKRYTKEEIVAMYLNQFDFLYNAVGIENAAKVYFNTTPKLLTKSQSACLVGMVKNPSLYNPRSYQIRDYKSVLAARKEVTLSQITNREVSDARAADSLLIHQRRNQVLMQWLINSDKGNEALHVKLSRAEYDQLKNEPIKIDYQPVDHKEGLAPYFRESLRKELTDLFEAKGENGKLKIAKKDGSAYNIYSDGLKIYTTINVSMQTYAEQAMERHLGEYLQAEFTKNNMRQKRFPFSNTYNGAAITDEQIESIMKRARKGSERFSMMRAAGASDSEISKAFNKQTAMRVFSWKGEFDTIMTPNDSIKYYKNFLHAGLMSVEPQTGFIKAWVGGTNINHFAYDHVKQGRRQVGSTIKPFVYGTALAMGSAKPCTHFSGGYCVDLEDGNGNVTGRWCPSGEAAGSMAQGLASSSNPTTVAVMSTMGGYSGPKTIAKLLRDLDINLDPSFEVPAMCLGPMDLSLYEMVGAQSMWVNNGIYNRPTAIVRIEDRNGNVIYSADGYSKEVMNANVAYETLNMMKGVISGGTGSRLRGSAAYGGIKYPMAGKTGTTQSNSDAWFMGLTPELVTGVWVGAEDKQVRFSSTGIGQGASSALPIFGYYMNKIYADPKLKISTGDFKVPANYDGSLFRCDGSDNPGNVPDFF